MDFWNSVSYKKMLPDKNLLICLLLLIFLCVGHQKFVFPSKLGCQLSAMNLATSFSQVFHGQSVHPWLCNPFSRLRGWLGWKQKKRTWSQPRLTAIVVHGCCCWLLQHISPWFLVCTQFLLLSVIQVNQRWGKYFEKSNKKFASFSPFLYSGNLFLLFLRASLQVPEASLLSEYFEKQQNKR